MEFSAVVNDAKPNFNRDDFNKLFEDKIIRDTKESVVNEAEVLAQMNTQNEPSPATRIHEQSISEFSNNLGTTIFSFLMDFFTMKPETIKQYVQGAKAVYTSIGLFFIILIIFVMI